MVPLFGCSDMWMLRYCRLDFKWNMDTYLEGAGSVQLDAQPHSHPISLTVILT